MPVKTHGLEVVSYNGSCWATLKGFLERTTAHVVLGQETKLKGEGRREAESWAIRNGWKPYISDCQFSDLKNPTGAVGIFVRKHIGTSMMKNPQSTIASLDIVQGWAAAVHIDTGIKGGLVVVPMYNEQKEGM